VEPRLPAHDAARKAIKFKKGGVTGGERFRRSTDVHGAFAGIPVVVQDVNAVNRTRAARKAMAGTLGVHPDAWMPPSSRRAASAGGTKQARPDTPGQGRQRTPGKGRDLLDLLRQLQRAPASATT
jgi:hypothetical protein